MNMYAVALVLASKGQLTTEQRKMDGDEKKSPVAIVRSWRPQPMCIWLGLREASDKRMGFLSHPLGRNRTLKHSEMENLSDMKRADFLSTLAPTGGHPPYFNETAHITFPGQCERGDLRAFHMLIAGRWLDVKKSSVASVCYK